MMTNLVECINSVLKGAQNLPVLALVRATYYRLNEIFTRKSAEAHEHKRVGFTYSVFAQQRIEVNMQQAGNIVVHRFDRQNDVFEVERLPCRHVIACCANQPLDWQLYVHDVYKIIEVLVVVYDKEMAQILHAEVDPKVHPEVQVVVVLVADMDAEERASTISIYVLMKLHSVKSDAMLVQ
ncbi:hypothetical protein Ahy_A02g006355 [Arachis hypogaea]|uniref:SWIM-type domain-containing protein n=1 Tax=Arachis hypogaea TaxID=3818 RepID=A0A445E9P6_ARAHY|nr:hypothetical protein Ahy_A02g006355 [Arachis hypogaea]